MKWSGILSNKVREVYCCVYCNALDIGATLYGTRLSLSRLSSYLHYQSVFTSIFIIILSAYRPTLSHPTTLSSSILSLGKENEKKKEEGYGMKGKGQTIIINNWKKEWSQIITSYNLELHKGLITSWNQNLSGPVVQLYCCIVIQLNQFRIFIYCREPHCTRIQVGKCKSQCIVKGV